MFGETFKNFHINFVTLNPTGVFHGGEMVSGDMRFELSDEVKIQKITMTVKGKAKVHWTESSGSEENRQTRYHSGKVVFFQLERDVLQAHVGADELVLQPGVHVYPFSCPLPQGDFPSTFEGFHGKISYAVIVGIHRALHMEKKMVSEFKFERFLNIGAPELLVPLSASNSNNFNCCWLLCCVSGEVSMDVRMERKGYIPGETIKIMAEFTNGTSRSFEPKAELEQTVTYYTNGRDHQDRVAVTLDRTRGPSLGPHTSDVHCDLTLNIPRDAHTSLENCEVLTIEYTVRVGLKVGVCPAVKVLLPIVIGNCRLPPLGGFQPPY